MTSNYPSFIVIFLNIILFFSRVLVTHGITAEEMADFCVSNQGACQACADDSATCSTAVKSCGNSADLPAQCQQVFTQCIAAQDASCFQATEALAADMNAAEPAICFHGSGMVDTTEHGLISMQQLSEIYGSEGEGVIHVKSWDRKAQKTMYSPLVTMVHADPTMDADFIEISTETNTVAVTPRHLIYRSKKCLGPPEVVFAGKISVGDCVFHEKQDGLTEPTVVTAVSNRVMSGTFAPLTEEGSILVDGIAASCFAENEDEELNRLIYGGLYRVAKWMKPFLPSSWSKTIFGIGRDINSRTPSLILGLSDLKSSIGFQPTLIVSIVPDPKSKNT